MRANERTDIAVRGMLEDYADAIERGDVNGIMALFAPDPDLVHIGTGQDEWCNGLAELREQFERALAQSKGMTICFWDQRVSAAGHVSWIAANVTVHAVVGREDRMFTGRATAVLERRGNRWYFVQSHFSLPAMNQEAGRSFPEEAPEDFVDAA